MLFSKLTYIVPLISSYLKNAALFVLVSKLTYIVPLISTVYTLTMLICLFFVPELTYIVPLISSYLDNAALFMLVSKLTYIVPLISSYLESAALNSLCCPFNIYRSYLENDALCFGL